MSSDTAPDQKGDPTANLRTDYEQINQQISMLTDIRFKLLALIPTGTTIAVSASGNYSGLMRQGWLWDCLVSLR